MRTIDIVAGDQFQPDFIALSPMGKVPVIVDRNGFGGKPYTVFESGAILIYLAEKAGKLLPNSPRGRMDALQWLVLQTAKVGPMFGQHKHFLRFAPAGNGYSAARYRTLAGRVYDALEKRLSASRYPAGDEYMIADVATYPWAALYHEAHGMRWEERPHLRCWCDEIALRPAVTHAVAALTRSPRMTRRGAWMRPPTASTGFLGAVPLPGDNPAARARRRSRREPCSASSDVHRSRVRRSQPEGSAALITQPHSQAAMNLSHVENSCYE